MASVQRCVGCQVIADKQESLAGEGDQHGKKIALIPAGIHAAMQLQQDLKDQHRRRRQRDNDDD
ncbi:hypothetical protein [Streptomyces sp. NPDC088348]|uniref:hypothetical protein n=1 Tax=Streptomyces sp. NPDC088348 TaxID=3365853 RepID=UPI00382AC11C